MHFWNDTGMGDHGLHYLRDKEKREVDFLVTRDKKPWLLIEVKKSDDVHLSKHLAYYQKQLNAPHAFQVAIDADYISKNLFDYHEPVIVPARTLLSQLV